MSYSSELKRCITGLNCRTSEAGAAWPGEQGGYLALKIALSALFPRASKNWSLLSGSALRCEKRAPIFQNFLVETPPDHPSKLAVAGFSACPLEWLPPLNQNRTRRPCEDRIYTIWSQCMEIQARVFSVMLSEVMLLTKCECGNITQNNRKRIYRISVDSEIHPIYPKSDIYEGTSIVLLTEKFIRYIRVLYCSKILHCQI